MTITVKIDKCHEKFSANVALKRKASDLDFSHTFKDGEKKKLPASSKDITGMGASNVDLYLEVGLKKVGRDISFKVRGNYCVAGSMSMRDKGKSEVLIGHLSGQDMVNPEFWLATWACEIRQILGSDWPPERARYGESWVLIGNLSIRDKANPGFWLATRAVNMIMGVSGPHGISYVSPRNKTK